MSKKYYGNSTGEDGCGIGDIIEGQDYKRRNSSWYIEVPVNEEKCELGCIDIEVFNIWTIENNEIKYVGGTLEHKTNLSD